MRQDNFVRGNQYNYYKPENNSWLKSNIIGIASIIIGIVAIIIEILLAHHLI